MTEYIYIDGKYIEKNKASLPIMTHAFLYGTSVFEGIRAYYNKNNDQLYIFRAKEHFERLVNSAKLLHMDTKYTIDEFCATTKELLKKNGYKQDTYIRPTLFKAGETVCPGLIDNPDSYLLFTLPMGDYIDVEKGLNVCVSNWRRNSDNAIPPMAKISGSYANTALIVTDARLAGFDDAIVLSEDGFVTEGSAMNFFMVKDGKLITAKSTDDILIGVTRNTIIELAKDLGIKVEERQINRGELYSADEAFYTGTGAQIAPISSIDHRQLGDKNTKRIVPELQKLYFDVVKGNVNKYKEWCMPVYD